MKLGGPRLQGDGDLLKTHVIAATAQRDEDSAEGGFMGPLRIAPVEDSWSTQEVVEPHQELGVMGAQILVRRAGKDLATNDQVRAVCVVAKVIKDHQLSRMRTKHVLSFPRDF